MNDDAPRIASTTSLDALHTKQGIAVMLRCSVRTIDTWMQKGRLPYLKVGKTVRFRWADVLAKLAEFRVN